MVGIGYIPYYLLNLFLGFPEHSPITEVSGLRHTFLTEAGRHTQNVRARQNLAGHSKIQTTMRYVHPEESDMLELARAVQEARARKVTTFFTTTNSGINGRIA